MPVVSAGLMMYRVDNQELQVLLAHPGGPFFVKKDDGWWTIPKGEVDPGEELLSAARREFEEEIGIPASGPFTSLGSVKKKGGKVIHAWAFPGDCDPSTIVSNTFTIEWPPRSKKLMTFPEIDRVGFFNIETANVKLHPSQQPWLSQLETHLKTV